MRLPRLSPSVERRNATMVPADSARGDAVRPQCNIRLCEKDSDCSINPPCNSCHTATGLCIAA
jgi:hypothetical protein